MQMGIQSMKEGVAELAKKYDLHVKKSEGNPIENLEESLHKIQESIKNQDSYDNIVSEVDNFISQVEGKEKQKENKNELLTNEIKISLIASAKQFQETLKKIEIKKIW